MDHIDALEMQKSYQDAYLHMWTEAKQGRIISVEDNMVSSYELKYQNLRFQLTLCRRYPRVVGPDVSIVLGQL